MEAVEATEAVEVMIVFCIRVLEPAKISIPPPQLEKHTLSGTRQLL